MKCELRLIEPEDNVELASVIRKVLKEHGVDRPGTVYTDPTTDELFELFNSSQNAFYYVATVEEKIVGGCGIYPTSGLPDGFAELVKLYLLKEVRGMGLGKQLMQRCMEEAEHFYTHLYLETTPELSNAIGLYESLGFKTIKSRLGESGHFSCNVWMVKNL